MIEKLRTFNQSLKSLKADISKETAVMVGKKQLRDRAEALATSWFPEIASELAKHPVLSAQTIEVYSNAFARLLKLSSATNRRTSYLEVLTAPSKSFHDDIILPIQMEPKIAKEVSLLEKLFTDLGPAEDAYMKEAIACASHQYYRASAVLGWCAAIDRIHRVIETIGFAKFNATSKTMAAATSGRFKKFSSANNVATMSELREVFDGNILWILEGMGLIDNNQNTRLRSCYDLRCQCGHPGDAPVTEYNLASFFSDINEILFKNPKFAV
jgi:hypothetical protein